MVEAAARKRLAPRGHRPAATRAARQPLLAAVIVVAAVVLLGSQEAAATQIVHEPLESVLRKTEAAMVVEVLAVSPAQAEGIWQSVEFRARPGRLLFGARSACAAPVYRYVQGLPHQRGTTMVSPLVTGSGLELALAPGRRVIVLLGAADPGAAHCQVLRVEPPDQARRIQKQKKALAAAPAAPGPSSRTR
jgi:hypothetical protein